MFLLNKFWVGTFSSAAHIINHSPSPVLANKSSFKLLYHSTPKYTNFCGFGCRVLYLRPYSSHKLEPRSIEYIFIGYNAHYKGYMCLDPTTSRVQITHHACFDEANFPFSGKAPNSVEYSDGTPQPIQPSIPTPSKLPPNYPNNLCLTFLVPCDKTTSPSPASSPLATMSSEYDTSAPYVKSDASSLGLNTSPVGSTTSSPTSPVFQVRDPSNTYSQHPMRTHGKA